MNYTNIILKSIIILIVIFIVSRYLLKKIFKENYVDFIQTIQEKQNGLYKEDVGVVGKRKDFSHMRKPHLNPILIKY